MVTTVGMGSDLASLITDFIQLERDAIAAYDTCIERLEDPQHRERVEAFRADHHRHLSELEELARRNGADVPAEVSGKSLLTTGKVQMADLVGGDGPILSAMSTNETDTVTAYERGAEHEAIPAQDRAIFSRALQDERSHKAWMEETATRL